MNPVLFTQISELSRRSIVRLLRQPQVIAPALMFPLLIFGFQAAGLGPAADIPGFPADSYVSFLLAFPLVQGTLFAAVSAGTDLAKDIETGFLNRLSMTPMHPVALLIGMLAGVVSLGFLQSLVFILVGLVVGVTFEAGFLGVLVLVVLTTLTALGFGGVGAILALRTGSGEAVQGLFPLLLVTFFLSSILLPRDLIETDWFRTVATYNPVSYLVEGIRSLIITGWDAQALALGFIVAVGLIVVGLSGAVISLRGRVART
ncbi:MAG TPA: ABC transporter permease [Rubrobacteraceae bacterium]|nr:ABC transporter permease [Rubrobacteraceae bacterium]